MIYEVPKIQQPVELSSNWNSGSWQAAPAHELKNYMGNRPEHLPLTQVKLQYDDQALYVMFKVQDRYVRALAEHQGNVCRDSCVEFFFAPGREVDKGYFNLEINCGGTMLFHHQIVPRKDHVDIELADCKKITVYHNLPEKIDPEISEPVTWFIAYRMPFEILTKYANIEMPRPGTTWRANFYKCADGTSHPHWLTWSPVNRPKPNFHVPEDFGTLKFQ